MILAANVACDGCGREGNGLDFGCDAGGFKSVGTGVVKSLERPGTNVTGTTMYAPELIAARWGFLKRIVPDLDKVSMVLNGNNR